MPDLPYPAALRAPEPAELPERRTRPCILRAAFSAFLTRLDAWVRANGDAIEAVGVALPTPVLRSEEDLE